jgi:nitronate monooxygenase
MRTRRSPQARRSSLPRGTEAGGHGRSRTTLTLTPEIADLLVRESPDTLLVSAGGIADGRGLAAALMLGADGVLIGSRLWASEEALVHPNHHRAAIAASGDDTIRQRAADIVRLHPWPDEFTGRVLRNAFTERWADREDELRRQAETLNPAYQAGVAAGDPDNVAVWVGEAAGLIDRVRPACELIRAMASEAERLLGPYARGLLA